MSNGVKHVVPQSSLPELPRERDKRRRDYLKYSPTLAHENINRVGLTDFSLYIEYCFTGFVLTSLLIV